MFRQSSRTIRLLADCRLVRLATAVLLAASSAALIERFATFLLDFPILVMLDLDLDAGGLHTLLQWLLLMLRIRIRVALLAEFRLSLYEAFV